MEYSNLNSGIAQIKCPLIRMSDGFDDIEDIYPRRVFCSRPLNILYGCILGYGHDGSIDICDSGASIGFCPVDGLITEEKLREFKQMCEIPDDV